MSGPDAGAAPLVVLAPHPDDELLGAGALIARAVRAGRVVAVVLLTDGAASHPGQAGLAERRLAEARAGVAALGLDPACLTSLGVADGTLEAGTLDLAPLTARLPRRAVLVVTDPTDAHPDHRAAFGVATRLCAPLAASALWTMPVSQRIDGLFTPTPRWQRVAVGELAGVKAAALAAHASQMAAADGYRVPQAAVTAFTEAEYFARAWSADDDGAVAAAHFDALFTASGDPWGYASETYEAQRFRRTLAAVGPAPGRVFEAGSGAGHLTARLAGVADAVVGVEASGVALALARERLAGVRHVTLLHGALPEAMAEVMRAGPFETVLLSDMLYYLGLDGVIALAAAVGAMPGARRLVVTNYLGETDCALTGDMAAEALIAHVPGWRRIAQDRCERLRIDVLEAAR